MLKLKQSEILIRNGAIEEAGNLLSQITKSKRCVIISDTNVAPLYLDKLISI